ncbi:MAG: hypothetical protein ACXWPM_02115 [Bdellovibrionota bacterium]
MKLFHFYRLEDYSGVSGTGPVVEGVQFSNGWCALRWISGKSSMCFYQSLEDVKAIHSHGGRTEVIVHDFEPLKRKRGQKVETPQMELLMQIIEETSRVIASAETGVATPRETRQDIRTVKSLLDRLEKKILGESPQAA